jgi:hypothetical protein
MEKIEITTAWLIHAQKFAQSLETKRAEGDDYTLELDMLLGWLSSIETIIKSKQ